MFTNYLIAVAAIILVVAVIAVLIYRYKKYRNEKIKKAKDEVLKYISLHEGEAFDFEYNCISQKIKRKQLYKILLQLKSEDIIVAHQRYLRKPILLSDNDYENFFWKVYILSKKYPQSMLGTLSAEPEVFQQ